MKITDFDRGVGFIDGAFFGKSCPCCFNVQHTVHNGQKHKDALKHLKLTLSGGPLIHAHTQ